jgi:hypothetical protein
MLEHICVTTLCACFRVLFVLAAKVDIMGPKVELSLVKADGTNWERLGDVVENGEGA